MSSAAAILMVSADVVSPDAAAAQCSSAGDGTSEDGSSGDGTSGDGTSGDGASGAGDSGCDDSQDLDEEDSPGITEVVGQEAGETPVVPTTEVAPVDVVDGVNEEQVSVGNEDARTKVKEAEAQETDSEADIELHADVESDIAPGGENPIDLVLPENADEVDILDFIEARERGRPCCAGAGLSDQQIQELPEAAWNELIKRSEREQKLQEQLISDHRNFEGWNAAYEKVNQLTRESALALELNDINRARELHSQATELWANAPEVSYFFAAGHASEPLGPTYDLEVIDAALEDGARTILGTDRERFNLPELPSRLPPEPEPEPSGEQRGPVSVDNLDLTSLARAVDGVLEETPDATRTVRVTLIQGSDMLTTAAVDIELVNGEVVNVNIEGFPVPEAFDRIQRDLRLIRPNNSTSPSVKDGDPNPMPEKPVPARPVPGGLQLSGPDASDGGDGSDKPSPKNTRGFRFDEFDFGTLNFSFSASTEDASSNKSGDQPDYDRLGVGAGNDSTIDMFGTDFDSSIDATIWDFSDWDLSFMGGRWGDNRSMTTDTPVADESSGNNERIPNMSPVESYEVPIEKPLPGSESNDPEPDENGAAPLVFGNYQLNRSFDTGWDLSFGASDSGSSSFGSWTDASDEVPTVETSAASRSSRGDDIWSLGDWLTDSNWTTSDWSFSGSLSDESANPKPDQVTSVQTNGNHADNSDSDSDGDTFGSLASGSSSSNSSSSSSSSSGIDTSTDDSFDDWSDSDWDAGWDDVDWDAGWY